MQKKKFRLFYFMNKKKKKPVTFQVPNIMLSLNSLYIMQIPLLDRYFSCEFLDFIMKFDLTDKQNIMSAVFSIGLKCRR